MLERIIGSGQAKHWLPFSVCANCVWVIAVLAVSRDSVNARKPLWAEVKEHLRE